MEPVVLTPAQVAELAQVSRDTVYEELKAGRLEGVRVRREWRIGWPQLNRWLGLSQEAVA